MATIAPSALAPPGTAAVMRTVTSTTLTGTADTFVYDPTVPGSVLIMENPTGAAIASCRIFGSLASSVVIPGLQTFLLTAGLSVGSIAAGTARAIALDTVALWLPGTISITGGTGLVCYLLTQS